MPINFLIATVAIFFRCLSIFLMRHPFLHVHGVSAALVSVEELPSPSDPSK